MALHDLLAAFDLAARRHSGQHRGDEGQSPFMNHVVAVAAVLAVEGGVTDLDLLTAAVLHDSVEDTPTTFEELTEQFGPIVAGLVREVTDDAVLPYARRKELQIANAPTLSAAAKQLRVADKIANLRDITERPPVGWSLERRSQYLSWSEQVVAGCRGANPQLDRVFDHAAERCRETL